MNHKRKIYKITQGLTRAEASKLKQEMIQHAMCKCMRLAKLEKVYMGELWGKMRIWLDKPQDAPPPRFLSELALEIVNMAGPESEVKSEKEWQLSHCREYMTSLKGAGNE
jgi:hypothetical protein